MEPFDQSFSADAGIAYRLSRAVARMFPTKAVLDGLGEGFDIHELAHEGQCEATPRREPHPSFDVEWTRAHGLHEQPSCAVLDVKWRGGSYVVVAAEWPERWSIRKWSAVIADTDAAAHELAAAVFAFCNDPRSSVLTFASGCWSKDRALWDAVQASSFDDLVLARHMKDTIREDLTAFVAGKDEYAAAGVPWKRGILFLGPPGNGKTHCLRATIKHLGLPCLYVKSLRSRYDTDDQNIDRVFARAREITPCCLVFEDLDAMITDENRSLFLNQVDGFSVSSGLVTLATTNHPERLDPAITERPSRFDRKYHFDLPQAEERAAFLAMWNHRLAPEMRVADSDLTLLVDDTAGFSFAYLKELYVSGMVRWMQEKQQKRAGSMIALLRGQLQTLREQMTTEAKPPPKKKTDDA
jgi:hypothetical protein